MNVTITITIGPYEITPHPSSDGRVFIEVMRIDGQDSHEHLVGETRTVDIAELFKDKP